MLITDVIRNFMDNYENNLRNFYNYELTYSEKDKIHTLIYTLIKTLRDLELIKEFK